MKTTHPQTHRTSPFVALLLIALAGLSASCGVMDVRNATDYSSVIAEPSTSGRSTSPSPKEANASEGPAPLLVAVNVVRAPFVVLVGAMEVLGEVYYGAN